MWALVRHLSIVLSFEMDIAGKSTFLKIMETFPGVKTFPEPVEKWQKVVNFILTLLS